MEGSLIYLSGERQSSSSDRLLPGQVPAEAAQEPDVTQGRRRQQSAGQSLTCGEGGGGEAAPRRVLGSLQEHCVVCALRQALQSDPRVLCIHNQLLWNGGAAGVGTGEEKAAPVASRAPVFLSSHNKEKMEPMSREDSAYLPGAGWDRRRHLCAIESGAFQTALSPREQGEWDPRPPYSICNRLALPEYSACSASQYDFTLKKPSTLTEV